MKSLSTFEPRASALGCREKPQPIVLPHHHASCAFDKLSLGTDSGYGSASSSASSTPEKLQKPFDEECSQKSSHAVDKRSTEQPTPIRSHSPKLSIRSRTFTRRTVKIKAFDKDISELVQNRFKDLNELFGKPLYDHLSKKQPLTSMISIKLKVLGTNENDAKPWIVVMCDKPISKKAKQFFNQPHIKSEYQPHNADETLPFFEIVICDRPPRLLAGNPHLNVYSDFQPVNDDSDTSSGQILRIGESDKGGIATLGGVVMIESLTKEVTLYGMTSGHAVTQDLISDDGAMPPTLSSGMDDEEEDYNDCSYDSPEDSEEFEVESAYEDDEYAVSTNIVKDRGPSTEHTICWRKIGSVLSASNYVQRDGANLDWALVEMKCPSLYYRHMFRRPFSGSKDLEHDHAENESEKLVYFTGGVSGWGQGILSRTMSYILLAPGTNFTKVYSLALTHGIGLKAGDCGSWVIDSSSQEVYGHIVASDIFGEAYVIPLEAAFQDMQKKLGVKSVSLPTGRDILDWLRLHCDLSSFVHSQDDPPQNSTDDIEKGKCQDRNKPLPPTTVLSHQKVESHQSVLGKCAVNEERPSSTTSESSITNITKSEIKLPPPVYHSNARKPPDEPRPPLYDGSTYKTLVSPRITDDSSTTFGGNTLTASQQAMIMPSILSYWNTPEITDDSSTTFGGNTLTASQQVMNMPSALSIWHIPKKIKESFQHVSSKLANVTARTEQPSPLPEFCADANSPSSHPISPRMLGDYEISEVRPFERSIGTDSGYGSAQTSPVLSTDKPKPVSTRTDIKIKRHKLFGFLRNWKFSNK